MSLQRRRSVHKQSPTMNNTGASILYSGANAEDEFRRTSTKISSFVPPSTQQLRKVIQELEKMVAEERQKRKSLEQYLYEYRKRVLMKEIQFQKILHKLGYSDAPKQVSQIDKLYTNILTKFDECNTQSINIMQKKYEQNMQLMNRRCSQVVQKASQELSKVKRLSEEDFSRIKRDIQDILFLSKYLEEQNSSLKKKLTALQFKVKVLAEERAFVIQQLIVKKKTIQKLAKAKNQIPNPESKERSVQRQKSVCSQKSKDPKIKFSTAQISKRIENANSLSQNKSKFSSALIYPSKNFSSCNSTLPTRAKQLMINNKGTPKNQQRGQYQIPHISEFMETVTPTPKMSKQFIPGRSRAYHPRRPVTKAANPIVFPQSSSFVDDSQSRFQQTIKHLKQCLCREKKKRQQLGAVLSQFQSQNKLINDTIQQCLRDAPQSRFKAQNGNVATVNSTTLSTKDNTAILDTLIKSEKLFQVIKDIKKRLGRTETISLNCGWGEQDAKLLQKLQKDDEIKPMTEENEADIISSAGKRQTYIDQINIA